MITLKIKDCNNEVIMITPWQKEFIPQVGDSILLYRGIDEKQVKANVLHRVFDTKEMSLVTLITDYTDKLISHA